MRRSHGPLLGLICVGLLAGGCLVRASAFDAEVRRANALGEELELSEVRVEELERRVHSLQATEETLELERASLSQERVALLVEIEEMRLGNEALRAEVSAEREVREIREAEIVELSGSYLNLVEQLEQEIESGKLEIHRLRGRLQVRALDRILFDSGSATIKPEGDEVLSKLAVQLRKIPGHTIRVEGHTDDVPIATERFPSNWELSGARAAVVVRLLIQRGLDPTKLAASGFADQQPIAGNDSESGRTRNRRIEIVLVPEEGD